MALSVVYATVNGELVEETREGVTTTYVSDTLGSVIQTRNAAGTQTSSTAYWPFGEVRTSTGTNPSPWGFCGTWGYFRDALNRLYVRARILRLDLSRWLTVDPLWPREKPYSYANQRSTDTVDPSGMISWIIIGIIGLVGLACALCVLKVLDALSDIDLGTQDKRKHCVMACMLGMLCGPVCSALFAGGTEIFDIICRILGGDCHPSLDDIAANLAGATCGNLHLVTTCIPWWIFSPRPWCEYCCRATNYGGQGPGAGGITPRV